MTTAVVASKASMSRKSAFSNAFTWNHFQDFPPLVDLPTVPLVPLTQRILSLTTLSPRMEVLVPDVRVSILGTAFCAQDNAVEKTKKERRMIFFIVVKTGD